MLYKITKTYSLVTGTATESVPRTAMAYSLEHKMLHIINSLYFALVTTFTVQSCTMGEWYESIICLMISIEVLSHCDYQYKGEKQKYQRWFYFLSRQRIMNCFLRHCLHSFRKQPVPYKSSRIVCHLCSVFIYFAFL